MQSVLLCIPSGAERPEQQTPKQRNVQKSRVKAGGGVKPNLRGIFPVSAQRWPSSMAECSAESAS
eukprot:4716243-Alexandrium_andersonii.AAC.1